MSAIDDVALSKVACAPSSQWKNMLGTTIFIANIVFALDFVKEWHGDHEISEVWGLGYVSVSRAP